MSEDDQQDADVHRIAHVAIKPRRDQFLGRINGSGRAASLNQEIPEGPNGSSADRPKGKASQARVCLDLWLSQQKAEYNLPPFPATIRNKEI
jgi:hypothetical protein